MAPLAQKRNASTTKSSKRAKGATTLTRSNALVPRLMGRSRIRPNEVKYVDTQISFNSTSTATFVLLNGTIPGSEFYNRIGSTLFMQSLHLKLAIKNATNVTEVVRVVVMYDAQTNVTAPASLANVISDLDNAGTVSTTVYSGQNPQQSFRYKFLLDKRIMVTAGGGTVFPTSSELVMNEFRKLYNMETRYNKGTAGDVTDISTGSLYLIVYSQSANVIAVQGSSRLRFLD